MYICIGFDGCNQHTCTLICSDIGNSTPEEIVLQELTRLAEKMTQKSECPFVFMTSPVLTNGTPLTLYNTSVPTAHLLSLPFVSAQQWVSLL